MSTNEALTTRSMPRRSRWLMFPPPLLFVVVFFVGALLGRLVPLRLVPAAPEARTRVAGGGRPAMGALLLAPAPALFLRHWTTIAPHGKASSLVVSGPYRLT